jgi:small subunit ribosomal protein S17
MAEEEDKAAEEQREAEAEEQAPEAEAPEEGPAEDASEQAADAPAEESAAESADDTESTEGAAEGTDPAAGGSEAEEAAGADDDLDWKTRRRLERSRRPAEPGPQRTPEERQAERQQLRAAKAAERRRHRASRRAKKSEPGTGTPPAERRPNPAKVRQGVVVSDGADKTITVRIDIARRHPTYEKIVRRSRTLRAHDERNEAGAGDVVRVVETRPLSRSKRWRLVDIIEKAQ